jgi:hypothetical protein
MSLDADIDQESSLSTSSPKRHFLIVPSFNPERRHSWGNVVSHSSHRNNVAASFITITAHVDSNKRWEVLFMTYNNRYVLIHLMFKVEEEAEKREKKNRERKERVRQKLVNAEVEGI